MTADKFEAHVKISYCDHLQELFKVAIRKKATHSVIHIGDLHLMALCQKCTLNMPKTAHAFISDEQKRMEYEHTRKVDFHPG